MISKNDFTSLKNDFVLMKQEFKSSFGIEDKNKAIEVSSLEILGYKLFPVQEQWIEFCFKEDGRLTKMLLAARRIWQDRHCNSI